MYQKNELLTVEITDIGNDGEGIGRCDGYTLFVKDAVVGDIVEARITKPKKNYAYARAEKIVKSSPFRTQAPCPVYKRCGGCQIQALSYAKQLEYKQNKVRNHFIRIGGFEESLIDRVTEPIVGMPEPYRYRNKAQYPFGTDRSGKTITGFYAGRTHTIIPGTDCLLGAEGNSRILACVLAYMEENEVPAYDERTGKGLIRHVLIRTGFATGEIMVCVVINGRSLPNAGRLVKKLRGIADMTSISYCVNMEKTNVIMGTEAVTIWGTPYITDRLRTYRPGLRELDGHEVTFRISPLSFYQVNPGQTEKLYSLALEYAGLTGKETVWDLYCGIGTISLFLAGYAGQVFGVEAVPQAVADARENARRNGITNAEFFLGRAEDVLPKLYAEADSEKMAHPDVIVVDPPRKGCDEACLRTMLAMRPSRIVYVSCDSATLARDVRFLADGGYELKRIRPVDQFAQTVHVESVVLISRDQQLVI